MTGFSLSRKKPIEITFTPLPCSGMTMLLNATGRPETPSIRGIE
jgi:hypothetical protein